LSPSAIKKNSSPKRFSSNGGRHAALLIGAPVEAIGRGAQVSNGDAQEPYVATLGAEGP
jgi:hypothetical protein